MSRLNAVGLFFDHIKVVAEDCNLRDTNAIRPNEKTLWENM